MCSQNRRLCSIVVALGLALILLAGWGAPARSASSTVPVSTVYHDPFLADEPDGAFRPMNASSTVLITAVYYDTYLTDEPDEAFRLMNVGGAAVDLTGWTVTDGPNEGTITLQGSLAPGVAIWIAREAAGFSLEFGFSPAYEYEGDTVPAVP